MGKITGIFVFTIILFQIVFSFYYSSEIINQNTRLDNNLAEYQKLYDDNKRYEKEYAQLTSMHKLEKELSSKPFVPIKNIIKIDN